jgi:hypothetical protein
MAVSLVGHHNAMGAISYTEEVCSVWVIYPIAVVVVCLLIGQTIDTLLARIGAWSTKVTN